MKLSLAWIFDHINGSWQDHDIPALINRFNTTTAEIEYFDFISLDLEAFTLVTIVDFNDKNAITYSKELEKEIVLPHRSSLSKEQCFLIKKDKAGFRWATGHDFYATKELLLPALIATHDELKGSWKQKFQKEDYILTIGNTSITHRPDLWSHRGVAREIAPMIGVDLKPEKHFLTDYPLKNITTNKTNVDGFTLELATSKCNRFAVLPIKSINFTPSLLWMASRLLRVDSKPINALVDATNYVMFDIGQPMHAFDAKKIKSKTLKITHAQEGEQLQLLDDQRISLKSDNIIISDGTHPIALAGIMGGISTAVDEKTDSLLIEAAHFDHLSIRTTAQQFKIRTEASTRFEKSIDPMQTPKALMRFLHILDKNSIPYKAEVEIQLLDQLSHKETSIELPHALIEKKIGVTIKQDFITRTLAALGFETGIFKTEPLTYIIKVPSFRMKDIIIAEDLIEEIARWFGFDAIPHELPRLALSPTDEQPFNIRYAVKQFFAYTGKMREVCNYAFFDEEYLKTIQWKPEQTLLLKNPVSEQMNRLVTSLIPNLFKNITTNHVQEQSLNFFELNKIWQVNDPSQDFVEKNNLSGIFFDGKKKVDFYHKKEVLEEFFKFLGRDISWQKPSDQTLSSWYHPYKTALLTYKETIIGYAGCVNPYFIQKFLPGDAFIFEIDSDRLLEIEPKQKIFTPLARYQDSSRDISMLVPLTVTVEQLKDLILKADSSLYRVDLIDFFQKDEWIDKRSITLRFYTRDPHKTLSTEQINEIYNRLLTVLLPLGAEIR